MLAVQFIDYPMDASEISFGVMLKALADQRWLVLGFGATVSALLLVPLVNLLVIPAAVIGGSLLASEHFLTAMAPAQDQSRLIEDRPKGLPEDSTDST